MAVKNAESIEGFGCGVSVERLEDDDDEMKGDRLGGKRLISFYATQNDMGFPIANKNQKVAFYVQMYHQSSKLYYFTT